MESDGCVETTSPFWAFEAMFFAGAVLLVAATMLVALTMQPRVSDGSRRQTGFVLAVVAGQTVFFLWQEYVYIGGWKAVWSAVGHLFGFAIGCAPVLVLVLKRRSLARQGLAVHGLWAAALVSARVLMAGAVLVSGTVTSMAIWIQFLSLRPC